MRTSEIERWALNVIRQVERQQPVEDSRVELKSAWPTDHSKAARRIAGHANAARGEHILWLIGVDETVGVVGADYVEFSNWIRQVESNFDQLSPRAHSLDVPTNSGQTVVALVFETSRAPFVVKNPAYGSRPNDPISLEVPWRDGTSTRSATRADLLLVLSDVSSLGGLLNELEWNLDISRRTGSSQWQYRLSEFERFYTTPNFSALDDDLQRSIREAYIAISHAQSVLRTFENADWQQRSHISRQVIDARVRARPFIQEAVNNLQDFFGVARTTAATMP